MTPVGALGVANVVRGGGRIAVDLILVAAPSAAHEEGP
jgi:hypothetical protein